MNARVVIAALSPFGSREVNAHRTDLLRQQLRSRGIAFVEGATGWSFGVDTDTDSDTFSELVRLARRYGQTFISAYPEDGVERRYHLAPGSGGPSIISIEELP